MRSSLSITKLAKFAALAASVVFLLSLLTSSQVGHSQTPPESQGQSGQEDVLRINTELVQTDVMVFDQQGNFVPGLKREDFELRIDGKVRPIEFFEKITAGSANEETQLAAARGSVARPRAANAGIAAPLDRGRPVFFYVDDLHMDLSGMKTTRKVISTFIEKEMGQNDEAAITSASGQIGFLTQLTDNKSVLRAALERLKVRQYEVRDSERPAMSEYQAVLINNYDRDVTAYFVEETLKNNPGITPQIALNMVTTRARQLGQQGAFVTLNTLAGLDSLIRQVNKLPGRKLVFFISGGFFLDDRNSDTRDRIHRITSAAARNGVVVYSMDARGLVASLRDASDSQFDPTGRLERSNAGELVASQDSMFALAADTGGKAIFNTNAPELRLGGALKESSTYYLLAWKPEEQTEQKSKFRKLEVKVIGKPNLKVQVRRGFFDRDPPPEVAKASKTPDKAKKEPELTPGNVMDPGLKKAIGTPYPNTDIPVSLSLSYLNTPTKSAILSTALQVPNEFLSFEPVNGKPTAVVAVAGAIFNDQGKSGAAFNTRLTVESPADGAVGTRPDLMYGFPVSVGPGLYQVRVAVRDEKSGRTGTAYSWIEIPNLAAGEFALSTLLVGSRAATTVTNASASPAQLPDTVDMSVNHHFSPSGFLRFMVVIYNAALADAKPDVAIQMQMVRDGQPVVTTALRKVSTEGMPDLLRIPYAAEVSLSGLPAGQYLLKVSVVDRVAKKSASQQTHFEIE